MTRTSIGRNAAALLLVAVAAAGCTADPGDAGPDGAPEPIVVTAGPPPPPGATGEPVAGITTLPPVAVGEPAPFGQGLVARVVTVEPVQVEARGPGEIAGSGVAVTLELINESDADIDLDGIAVNSFYGDGIPATDNSAPPSAPVSGSLPPGESRQGVYLFQIPGDETDSVTVEINHSGSPNVVLVTS